MRTGIMAVAALLAMPLVAAPASTGLPWVEDDYARALHSARERHVPLFVEVWAPW